MIKPGNLKGAFLRADGQQGETAGIFVLFAVDGQPRASRADQLDHVSIHPNHLCELFQVRRVVGCDEGKCQGGGPASGFSKLYRRRRDFLPGIPSLSLDGDTPAHIVILPLRATMSIASGGHGLRK